MIAKATGGHAFGSPSPTSTKKPGPLEQISQTRQGGPALTRQESACLRQAWASRGDVTQLAAFARNCDRKSQPIEERFVQDPEGGPESRLWAPMPQPRKTASSLTQGHHIHMSYLRHLQNWLEWIPIFRGLVPEHQLPVERIGDPPARAAMTVVIVHGTFGSRSTWLQDNSKVVSAIRAVKDVSLHRFKWSGTNSTPHRIAAARNLAALCKELHDPLSQTVFVIVAHSHGGNISAWASTLLDFDLDAAVYVNTPFIHAVHPQVTRTVWGTILIFGGVLVAAGWSIDHANYFGSNPELPPLLILVLGSSAGFFAWHALKKISTQLRDLADHPRRIKHEVVVDVVGDEPSAGFAAVYFLRFFALALFKLFGHVFGVTAAASWLISLVWPHSIVAAVYPYLKVHSAIFLITGFALPLFFASLAYGTVQAVLSLDTSIAVAQGPTGNADLHTVIDPDQKLRRHRMDSQVVANKLNSIIAELKVRSLG